MAKSIVTEVNKLKSHVIYLENVNSGKPELLKSIIESYMSKIKTLQDALGFETRRDEEMESIDEVEIPLNREEPSDEFLSYIRTCKKYINITWSGRGTWTLRLYFDGKQRHVGSYSDIREALRIKHLCKTN